MLESCIFRQTSARILPTTNSTVVVLWKLSFKMGSFAIYCLQPLLNSISIKILEKY